MKNIYKLPTKWEWKGVHFFESRNGKGYPFPGSKNGQSNVHFLKVRMDCLMYISWNVCHKE